MRPTSFKALAELCEGFLDSKTFQTGVQLVNADELPDPFGRLLVHPNHMTTTLSDYYGRVMQLTVLRKSVKGDSYHRLIVLRPQGSARIVEVGLVRIDLGCTTRVVRDMILEGKRPLGEILISHDVMRRIEPKWYFRFDARCPLMAHFGEAPGAAFGRVGVIHCDGRPAIRLLEVVTG